MNELDDVDDLLGGSGIERSVIFKFVMLDPLLFVHLIVPVLMQA
jgi:hypothetical protein